VNCNSNIIAALETLFRKISTDHSTKAKCQRKFWITVAATWVLMDYEYKHKSTSDSGRRFLSTHCICLMVQQLHATLVWRMAARGSRVGWECVARHNLTLARRYRPLSGDSWSRPPENCRHSHKSRQHKRWDKEGGNITLWERNFLAWRRKRRCRYAELLMRFDFVGHKITRESTNSKQ
jgi:hypothetical protein